MGKINVNDQEVFGSPALGDTSLQGIGNGTVTSAIVTIKNQNDARYADILATKQKAQEAWDDVEAVEAVANAAKAKADAVETTLISVNANVTTAITTSETAYNKAVASDNKATEAKNNTSVAVSTANEASSNATSALKKANSIISGVGDNNATVKAMYAQNADSVGGHYVYKDVPENAKFTDTTYSTATSTSNGLMSSSDKGKLDSIAMTTISGVTMVNKAANDSSGNNIATQFSNITSGTTTVGKASSATYAESAGNNKYMEMSNTPVKYDSSTQTFQAYVNGSWVNVAQKKTLPSYWTNYLEGRLSVIQNALKCDGPSDAFVFSSDFHYKNNACYSGAITEWLMDKFPEVSFAANGGDFLVSYEATPEEYRENILAYTDDISSRQIFNVAGNHDYGNWSQNTNTGGYYSDSYIRSNMYGDAPSSINWGGNNSTPNYYVYNRKAKLMYIFVSDLEQNKVTKTGQSVRQDSAQWLAERLYNAPSGFDIIIICHAAVARMYDSNQGTASEDFEVDYKTGSEIVAAQPYFWGKQTSSAAVNVLSALRFNGRTSNTVNGVTYNYAGADGHVIAVLCGHNHTDCHYYAMLNSNNAMSTTTGGKPRTSGLPVISIMCDSMRTLASPKANGVQYSTWKEWQSSANKEYPPTEGVDVNGRKRIRGTQTEQALDLVVVDQDNTQIKLVRIGVGGSDGTNANYSGTYHMAKPWNSNGVRIFDYSGAI